MCIKRETDYFSNVNASAAFVPKIFTFWTVQWLMVFDNYDNADTFSNIQDFIPQSKYGAILITNRHPESNALVIYQSNHFIELLGLEESAAIFLFIQKSQTHKSNSLNAKKILKPLRCHLLAIIQAGAYIKKRKLRLCKFMDHYKCQKKLILECISQLSQFQKRLDNTKKEI